MEFFIDNITLVFVIFTVMAIVAIRQLGLRLTRQGVDRTVKSLNSQSYATDAAHTYVKSSPLWYRPECISVFEGVLVHSLSSFIGRLRLEYVTHEEFKASDVKEVNIWHFYVEIVLNKKISKSENFLNKLAQVTEFNTYWLQKGDKITAFKSLLSSKKVIEQLKQDLIKNGFNVVSHKPSQRLPKWLVVTAIILLLFVIFMYFQTQNTINNPNL